MNNNEIYQPRTYKFFGKPVRVVLVDKEPMIAVRDIAEAIDYHRRGIEQIIDRNMDFFERSIRNVTFPLLYSDKRLFGGRRRVQRFDKVKVIDIKGVIGLLIKMAPSRIKDESKRQRILNFQLWAVDLLENFIAGYLRETNPEDLDSLDEMLFNVPQGQKTLEMKRLQSELGINQDAAYALLRCRRAELGMKPYRLSKYGDKKIAARIEGVPADEVLRIHLARKAYKDKSGAKDFKNHAEFMRRLKAMREETGLLSPGISKELGITPMTYRNYENGKQFPTIKNFITLCKYFEVTPEYLLGVEAV